MKRKSLFAAAATLGMVAASLAGISTPANADLPTTLTPTADARVNGSSTGTNYGTANVLSAAPNTWNSYIKFPTAGIDDGAVITGASLEVYVDSTSASNLQVRPTVNSWSEGSITWANQPTEESAIATGSGGVQSGTWESIDLPVSEIRKAAPTSLMIKGTATGRVDFRSREYSNFAPRLVLEYDDGVPETILDDAFPQPGVTTAGTEASFWLLSDTAGSSFECKLNNGAWTACPSPSNPDQGYVNYTGLSDGTHTFQGRAVSGGVADPTPVSATWTVDTGTTPPPPTGGTPPPVDTGWTRIVDDRFESGGLPAHWRTYDGPYGSGPGNCAEPDNNFVENGSLVLKMEYQTTGKCGAGWYTGGMQIEKAKGAIDQTMTVRMRVVYTDPVNVRSHRNVPMRWVDDPNFQWMEGESDYCEGSSTTGCTTFLHYDPSNQQISKSHTFDVTQWQVFKVVHQNNRVQIILNGNTIWDYQGTTHTVPDAIRRAVLQQECRSSCPAASYAGQTERIEIDYVTIDNES